MLNRLLLVLFLLGVVWAGWRYMRTRDARWLKVLRIAPKVTFACLVLSFFWIIFDHWGKR